jgi:hypothetical protein
MQEKAGTQANPFLLPRGRPAPTSAPVAAAKALLRFVLAS